MSHAITYSCGHRSVCSCDQPSTATLGVRCPDCFASADTTPPEPQRDDLLAQQHAMIRELRDALDNVLNKCQLFGPLKMIDDAEDVLTRIDAGEPPAAWAKMQDALSAARHAAGWFAEHAGDCGEGACKDAHEDLEAKLNALEEAT